jgi:2-deoxy-D-gluconate 3-dehydrogenase
MKTASSGVFELFRLEGKRALITGCNRGIGRALAIALAEAGADIIGVSRTLEERGSAIEGEIRNRGRAFRGYQCDFADRSQLKQLCRQLTADFPAIDVLVNNAGIIRRQPAVEHSDEFWDSVIETNLSAQFLLSREVGRGMVERGSGKIIFIASLLAFQGGITVPGYAASKGAIAQLTKALANEWAAKGVQVNAIAPGYIATGNTAALREDKQRNEAIVARIPAGRWGTPEDLQGAIVFLASHASDYVNGSVLVIDGGWMGR